MGNLSKQRKATPPFRCLVLGGGAIVAECHLPAFRALGWLEHCLVVESYARNARILSERFPGVKVAGQSYQAVLGDTRKSDNFDGVLVALPNSLHTDATERALAIGLPVLCEKPLALTAADCLRIEKLAAHHHLPVFVGMVRRFVPALTALREALAQGWVGEVRRVVLTFGSNCKHWPWDTETVLRRDQGGCLLNMGIHFLDFLEWTFGSLKPVDYTDDYAGGIEVNCSFHLETAAGVPVNVRISWTHELDSSILVEGSRGTLTFRLDQFEQVSWRSTDGTLTSQLKSLVPFASGEWQPTIESCFAEQWCQFASAVRGDNGAASVLVEPKRAAQTHELIEWAYSRRAVAQPRLTAAARPTLPPAPVAVTGGTGFVGSHLVGRLVELGMTSVTVPVRNFRTGAQVARFPITMKRTDMLDIASCREAFRGVKHVFHLAYGATGRNGAQVTRVGTQNVLKAALAEGVESVVVFSTCSVWAGHFDGEVDETKPLKPGLGAYGWSKARMQEECLAFARMHPQMRVSVVAPGSVYGPRSELFCRLPCAAAKTGSFAWFAGGRGTCNWVHVDNLVDIAMLAVQRQEAHGEVFIAVEGQTTWREFLTPLVEPWLATIPDFNDRDVQQLKRAARPHGRLRDLLRAAINTPEIVAAVTRHPVLGRIKTFVAQRFSDRVERLRASKVGGDRILRPPPTPTAVSLWMSDIYGPTTVAYSAHKARKILGWQPVVGLREGLFECVEWLRSVDLRE